MRFEGLGVDELTAAIADRAADTRPRVATGFPSIDLLLHRGGMAPGTFALLGGRTRTRKTSVMLNMMARMAAKGVTVGLISLDESLENYAVKLASVITGQRADWLEENWGTKEGWPYVRQWKEAARDIGMTRGYRPSVDLLDQWLEECHTVPPRPQVVFIDYAQLLHRDQFHGQDVNRIPRLMEELQVWTSRNELVTVAVHQVGRDDGHGGKYHGHTPLSLEGLKYGGEEYADIVLGTYRPALDPLGNMRPDMAELMLGDKFDEEKYDEARGRVQRYERSTYLQLLKNRPGVDVDIEGVELLSPDESMQMKERGEAEARSVGEDNVLRLERK